MQRHSKLLKITLIVLSAMLVACERQPEGALGENAEYVPDKLDPGPYLSLDEEDGRLVVYLKNLSPDSLRINALLRFYGKQREVLFKFSGSNDVAMGQSGAFISPEKIPSNYELPLSPGEVHGVSIKKSDLRNVYNLKINSCYQVKAVYIDRMPGHENRVPDLESNAIRVCFP